MELHKIMIDRKKLEDSLAEKEKIISILLDKLDDSKKEIQKRDMVIRHLQVRKLN